MRKLLLSVTAAAIVAAGAFKPAPAHAVFVFFPFVLLTKEDKNFKAVNPYAPTKVKKARAKGKKK